MNFEFGAFPITYSKQSTSHLQNVYQYFCNNLHEQSKCPHYSSQTLFKSLFDTLKIQNIKKGCHQKSQRKIVHKKTTIQQTIQEMIDAQYKQNMALNPNCLFNKIYENGINGTYQNRNKIKTVFFKDDSIEIEYWGNKPDNFVTQYPGEIIVGKQNLNQLSEEEREELMWKNEQISEIFYEGEVNQGGYWLSIERVYRLLSGIMFMKAMWKIYQNK